MSAEASEETQQAVIGYRDAMTYVQQTPLMEFFDYSETLLSTLHFTITKYQPAKWPGRYRTGGIFVTSADPLEPVYTGPEVEVVPRLMNELIEWLRDGDVGAPAYARAAMAHLNLVGIHRQAQRVKRRYEWTVRLWNDLARLVAERGLPDRVVSALYAAAVGEVRRTTYQQDEGLSRDQAIRDIQALTRAGLLTPRGNATTRVYVLAGVATEIAQVATAAVRGPGRDPYAPPGDSGSA